MGAADLTHEYAREVAAVAAGCAPAEVRRFPTGAHHFVYEVCFDGAAPVVVRLTRPEEREVCRAAVALSRQLRPLGVPLPEIIENGTDAAIPYVILKRLPGRDLGHAAKELDQAALARVAAGVADAQAIVSQLPMGNGYGYAATPEAAPHRRWSDVLDEGLARARRRIISTGLFDLSALDRIERVMESLRPELDAVPPTPFLHDTTTKNVIVTQDGRLSGIVDVDDLCYGDPRHVAALTLASFLGGFARGGPVKYVELLMSHAGWTDDRIFRFYVAFCLADFMSEHGQSFNGNAPATTAEDRAQLQAAFDVAMARVS